nr:hypothetical protein [Sinorhizobium meliloti]
MSGSTTATAETSSSPPGSVTVIEFSLDDQNFTALEAGPLDPFPVFNGTALTTSWLQSSAAGVIIPPHEPQAREFRAEGSER